LNWFCEDTAEGKVLNGGLVSDEDMQHELRPYRCWRRGLPFLLYSRNPHLLATAGKLWVSFCIWECCWRVLTWLLCKLSHLRPHFPGFSAAVAGYLTRWESVIEYHRISWSTEQVTVAAQPT
jgi:hypothetical protein